MAVAEEVSPSVAPFEPDGVERVIRALVYLRSNDALDHIGLESRKCWRYFRGNRAPALRYADAKGGIEGVFAHRLGGVVEVDACKTPSVRANGSRTLRHVDGGRVGGQDHS